MSGDNEREMVTRGIQNGAAFYLTKPLTYSDIEKLWQHVFTRKMETKIMKQTEIRGQDSLQQQKQRISSIDGSSSKSNDQEHRPDSLRRQNQKISNIGVSSSKANGQETLLKPHELITRKEPLDDPLSDDETSRLPQIPKNGKGVVWKGKLQNLFLQAVEYMGVTHAEPKKIQEYMKVPGLTRKNIASHLQKHRFKDRVEKRTEPSTRAPSNVQPQNPQETSQYSFSSFQAESRDGSFQGFNAPSSLFPTNNNQRLLAPTHQPWLARSTSIENEQSINPQNIAAISHCNTTNCCDKFMSELNFNVREYLVDGYTDDGDTI
ncbi:two-component response regulator ARR2-like [Papaver somniferum]|uniref:two-component response regulator ARR2-like n=1 Tax=Papaver somniferum TaxID=3469 RepID=UPI000E704870|nr:two-component response regulator ARR2-like [Papaver somniferum]